MAKVLVLETHVRVMTLEWFMDNAKVPTVKISTDPTTGETKVRL